MILFVCAQDLREAWIGLIEKEQFRVLERTEIAPEALLATLDGFCRTHSVDLASLEGVCVVTGPGSFTSTRLSLTLVNSLHFVHAIPVYTLTNPDHLTPEALIATHGLGTRVASNTFAHVTYDRPPHITTPR